MMPPECAICMNDSFEDLSGLVTFACRPSDEEWHERCKQEGFVGHPPNAVWFCPQHSPEAKKRAHLTVDVAMKQLREVYA